MQNVEAPKLVDVTHAIIVAASAVVTAVIVFAALAIASRSATALPTYAYKEHKDCTYCHVNPNGGTVLNSIGRRYEANGYSF